MCETRGYVPGRGRAVGLGEREDVTRYNYYFCDFPCIIIVCNIACNFLTLPSELEMSLRTQQGKRVLESVLACF